MGRKSLVLWLLLLAPPGMNGQGTPTRLPASSALVGTWEMVEEQELGGGGQVTRRDRDVVGMLVYTMEGRMAVQIMYRHGRPTVTTANDIESTGLGLGHVHWGATAAQAAIDTYDAYFGTFVVDTLRSIVTHEVIGELRPPGIGARYERRFELHGEELWLSSPDPAQHWRIIWRRPRS